MARLHKTVIAIGSGLCLSCAVLTLCVWFIGRIYHQWGDQLDYFSDAWPDQAREAARQGDIHIISLLIRQGAEDSINGVMADDPQRRTCLMEAARCGHADIVKLLIAHHVSLNALDADGKSAEMLARENHHNYIVKLLQQAKKAGLQPSAK